MFAKSATLTSMSTMNISLPDAMKDFVDTQVAERGYGTSSEYVRELIRKEQERQHLRGLLLAGAASAPGAPADVAYFDALRARAQGATTSQRKPARRG
jgi:antitoxin ParD1/3/4